MNARETLELFKSTMKACITVGMDADKILELNVAVQEALEKQIPKKPIRIDKNGCFDGNWTMICPQCGLKLIERITTDEMSYPRLYHTSKYCDCGQAIDWSEEE